jgi:hypothetical protein
MTAALLRECRGIAENALFHGSEDVGYAIGAVIALQMETKSQWALLLAMADNFEGTITELCSAVLALLRARCKRLSRALKHTTDAKLAACGLAC